jgi:hypothetical protein
MSTASSTSTSTYHTSVTVANIPTTTPTSASNTASPSATAVATAEPTVPVAAIAGGAAGGAFALAIIVSFVVWLSCFRKKKGKPRNHGEGEQQSQDTMPLGEMTENLQSNPTDCKSKKRPICPNNKQRTISLTHSKQHHHPTLHPRQLSLPPSTAPSPPSVPLPSTLRTKTTPFTPLTTPTSPSTTTKSIRTSGGPRLKNCPLQRHRPVLHETISKLTGSYMETLAARLSCQAMM